MFTKISIFIFLRRLFVNMHTKWTWRWTLHFVNGVNIAANIASATTVLSQCTPVDKLWDRTVPGSCWPLETQAAVGIFQGGNFSSYRVTLKIPSLINEISIVRFLRFGLCNSSDCLLVECPHRLQDQSRNLFSHGIGLLVGIYFPY